MFELSVESDVIGLGITTADEDGDESMGVDSEAAGTGEVFEIEEIIQWV